MRNFTTELRKDLRVYHKAWSITIPAGTAFTCYKDKGLVHFASIVEGTRVTLPVYVARSYFTKPEPIEETVTSAEEAGELSSCLLEQRENTVHDPANGCPHCGYTVCVCDPPEMVCAECGKGCTDEEKMGYSPYLEGERARYQGEEGYDIPSDIPKGLTF